MQKSNRNWAFAAISCMILLAASTRFLMIPNFTAVGAMGLLGAAYFRNKIWAFAVPFAALFLSDLILNNGVYARMFPESYDGFVWFHAGSAWTYFGFAALVALGCLALSKVSPLRLLGVSLSASLVFFLISNFGVWMSSGMYPKTAGGLLACYAAGLPFLSPTALGDLFFVAVFFGAYEWGVKPSLQPSAAA